MRLRLLWFRWAWLFAFADSGSSPNEVIRFESTFWCGIGGAIKGVDGKMDIAINIPRRGKK